MIPTILLALIIIVVMIDVLVGIHRGFGFSVVRLIIWTIGTIICFLLARPVTVWLLCKMDKVPNMKQFSFDMFGDVLKTNTEAVGTHLTGTMVSFMVPVVFVGLFLIAKLVTWLIYCLVKLLIKKSAKKVQAHNAAVDAVKAIENFEESDEETPVFVPAPPSVDNTEEQDEGFGTFGIHPKEPEPAEQAETVEPTENMDVTDGLELIAQGTQNESTIEDNVTEDTENEAAGGGDGFETIAALSEDGFESLAREQGLEEDPELPGKKLKRKKSLSMLLTKKSKFSSVLGGVLGFVVSLITCAIVLSPAVGVIKTVAETEYSEELVDVFFDITGADIDDLVVAVFEKQEKPAGTISKDIEITSDFSIRSQDIVEIFTEREKSVVYYLLKYSGADAVSSFIYDRLIPVDVKDIGLDNKGFSTYNFTETVKSYLNMMPSIDRLIVTLNQGKGFGIDLLDRVEECLLLIMQDRGKGELLTHEDKLCLFNEFIDVINNRIDESPMVQKRGLDVEKFDHVENFDEITKKINYVFEITRRLIGSGILE